MTDPGGSALRLWGIILLILVGTLASRLSFLVLLGRLERVPEPVERLLELVPPAALAALVVPSFVVVDGSLAVSAGNERLLAGAGGAVAAWRTRSLLATVAVGMAVLWGVRLLG